MQIRYSHIEAYLQCPKRYKKLYIDKEVLQSETIDLHYGTAIHSAIQAHFDGGEPFDVFNMYWNSIKDKHLESGRYNWEDLGKMATDTFIPNFIRLHSKKIGILQMEETLEMSILDGKHSLSGTYDAIANVDQKLTLIDWKTSAREYPLSKIYRNPQLYIYAKMYEHKYGYLPEQIMYKVFIKQEKRIQSLKLELTKERLDNMMSNVYTICEDIVKRTETNTWFSNYNSCYCIDQKGCFK